MQPHLNTTEIITVADRFQEEVLQMQVSDEQADEHSEPRCSLQWFEPQSRQVWLRCND